MEAKKKALPMNRVVPAVIMAILAAAVVWFDPFYLGIAFVILGIVAQSEMKTVYEKVTAKPYFVIYLIPPAWFALWIAYGPLNLPLLTISLCFLAVLLGFLNWKRLMSTLLSAVYPGIPMFALAALCLFATYGEAATKALVQSSIIFVIGGVAVGDIAALIIGSKIGKRKLCPSISPGKTVAGLIAQLVATPLFIVGTWFAVKAWICPEFPIGDTLFIAFLCGPLAVAGDLYASWFKRKAGIKDFGKLLGGHGGVLDRFDGMGPAALFAVIWFVCWHPFYFS
jgi:phosphatidate cytidylyltransferase